MNYIRKVDTQLAGSLISERFNITQLDKMKKNPTHPVQMMVMGWGGGVGGGGVHGGEKGCMSVYVSLHAGITVWCILVLSPTYLVITSFV